MSFLLINLRAVLRTMKARKARTLLTILGIVIGVAGVILIVAMGAGAQHLVLSQITKLGTNLIGVLPGKSDESGPPAAVFGVQVTTLTNQDAEALANRTRFPDIQAVAGFVRGSATLVWKNENVDTFFTATQASYPVLHDLEMESGRFFEEQEETSAANVMVLGYDIKDLLFGNTDPLGQVVKIKSVPFVVVGVASKQGTVAFQNQDDQVFVPLLVGQRQLLGIKYLQFIRAKVEPDSDVKQIIAEIRLLLRERHKIAKEEDADFSVMALAEAIKVLTNITDSLRLFLTVMAGVALLVGGIGIMNIMLVAVAERTREIGLRKALGASSRMIRNQFLLESSILTLSGGVIGIALGVILAFLVFLGARFAGLDWAFVISPVAVFLAVGLSVLTGLFFGFYPAVRASKLDPIVALRYE